MDTNTELTQLKEEVADLKRQLRELSKFICINGTATGKQKLVITCSSIHVEDPDAEAGGYASIWAGKDGPQINFFDQKETKRLALTLDPKEGGAIQLFEPDNALAVHIGYSQDNHPAVGVFHQGQPRAALKATEKLGIVSAVHNGGQARVTMISQETSGEILMLNPDMKVAVKLSTQGQQDEGFLTVNHANGKAAVIISALKEHGCVILNDRAGKVKYSLPDPNNL